MALVAVVFMTNAAAGASGKKLVGSELKQALSGKTVYLSTALGVSVPIRYRGNGTMSGRAAAVLVKHVGSKTDRGRWWISGNRVCQRWSKWLNGRSFCFSFRKKGRYVYWRRSDGRTGTATISH